MPHIRRVGELTGGDRHVKTDELSSSTLPIDKGSVMAFTEELDYSKVCARQMPRMLTDTYKETRNETATDLLHPYHTAEGSLSRIITGNETWVHHFEPQSKRHPQERRNSKVRRQLEKTCLQSHLLSRCRTVWPSSTPISPITTLPNI
jgi:hypothetical protein